MLPAVLTFAAPALGGPPSSSSAAAESAAYSWADKCPATAMAAGLYQGAEFERVPVGDRTVLRFRSGTPAATQASLLDQTTTWMLGEGCRAVGLTRRGLDQGRATYGFVVAKETNAPTAAEQAILLTWAGRFAWDADLPAHAAATLAFTPPPTPTSTDGGHLTRTPGRAWRAGPLPLQTAAWRAGSTAPAGATCPCWEAFEPVAPGKTLHAGGVLHSFLGAALLEDTAHDRWAPEPPRPFHAGKPHLRPLVGPAPASLAAVEFAWWPLADSFVLAAVDPATGASFTFTVPRDRGLTNPAALWGAETLDFVGYPLAAATLREWLGLP